MASSPRTGRPNPAIAAVAVGVVLLIGIVVALAAGFDPLAAGQGFVLGLFPPDAVTDRGERIRELYAIVFIIARSSSSSSRP